MATGRVKSFDSKQGPGWLVTNDGKDVFVTLKALPKGTLSLEDGERVRFDIEKGEKGEQAINVEMIA